MCVCVVRCACCVCVVRACARAVCALHANRTNVDNTSVCNRVCIRAVKRREGARPEVLSYGAEQLGVFPVCVDDSLRPPRTYRPRQPPTPPNHYGRTQDNVRMSTCTRTHTTPGDRPRFFYELRNPGRVAGTFVLWNSCV
jgi:hypothetical protein